MTLQEAIKHRHSVRQYINKPIEPDKIEQIRIAIDKANSNGNVHLQIITNDTKAFASGLAKYGKFQNVHNYVAVVAPKGKQGDILAGYWGEQIVLLIQTLELNSCWVGLTFKKDKSAYKIDNNEELKCVIAFGYGANEGVQHPQKKTIADVAVNKSNSNNFPDWFVKGVDAALLAPTAVNQQKFQFILHENNIIECVTKFSIMGYTYIDLGIVKCHFEIGADTNIFNWSTHK